MFVVVVPSSLNYAKSIFGSLRMLVVDGHKFLGGYIRCSDKILCYKRYDWYFQVQTLAAMASSQLTLPLQIPAIKMEFYYEGKCWLRFHWH